jgi:hypothetical protein
VIFDEGTLGEGVEGEPEDECYVDGRFFNEKTGRYEREPPTCGRVEGTSSTGASLFVTCYVPNQESEGWYGWQWIPKAGHFAFYLSGHVVIYVEGVGYVAWPARKGNACALPQRFPMINGTTVRLALRC